MRQNAPRETDPFKPFKHPAKMCLNSRGGLNNLISIHLVRALAAFTLSMKQVHWMYKWGINCNLLSEWMIRSNEHDMIFFCRICYLPCFVLRMDMQSINANDWHCWAVFKFRFEPTWLQSQYDAPFIYLYICGIFVALCLYLTAVNVCTHRNLREMIMTFKTNNTENIVVTWYMFEKLSQRKATNL